MTKFAIGCLVQWYEVEIIEEYFASLRKAIDNYPVEVIVDVAVSSDQTLEKCESPDKLSYCMHKIYHVAERYGFAPYHTEGLTTIADYRRTFNDRYNTQVDVLIWGESDMLVPVEMFHYLNALHSQVQESTPKYIATFATCKMWDDSWKEIEHVKFRDKPSQDEYKNEWWHVKYTMTYDEMQAINQETAHEVVVTQTSHPKFNGCGFVMSSEVVKAGVNIPSSVFFVHEDTAMMFMVRKLLGNIPQYVFPNVLLVHNRNHPKKRMYVQGEEGESMNAKRRSNDWYVKANKYSEENCYRLFDVTYKSKTWKDIL